MTKKRLLSSIGIILLFSGIGYWGYLQFLAPVDETAGAATVSNSAENQTELTAVTAEGQIVPQAQAQLAFQGNGVVTAAPVSPGDAVQRGDPLLLLDSVEQEIALQQAKAVLRQAEANLLMSKAGVLAAETAVTAAEVGVEAAEANLALLTAPPTAAQINLSEQQIAAANANVALAAANQNVLLEGNSSAQIRAAEAAVAAAEAAYTAALRTHEPITQNETAALEEREQAQMQLNAAATNLAAAQAALAELQAGASAPQQVAAAGGLQVAQNQREAAEAELALLQAGALAEQGAVAQAKLDVARERLAEVTLQMQQAETAVSQAEATISEADAGVAAAQLALEKRTLLAPFDGIVVDIFPWIGEIVTAGQPVVIVADFSQWRVETTDLVEADVLAIALGDEATVAVDAFAARPLQGEIIEIAQLSAEVRGDVTYRVTLALPQGDSLPLRWGMSAFITIGQETAVSAVPQTQNNVDIVSAEGQLMPRNQVTLAFQTAGEVAAVFVAEGDHVQAGDPLLQLDSAAADLGLQQAEARLATAQASLTAAENEKALAETAVNTASAQVTVAQANLALVQANPQAEQISAAESRLAAAEAAVTQAIGNRDAALNAADTSDILAAEAAVATAQAEVQRLEQVYDAILIDCIDTPQGEVCPLYGPVEETTRQQLTAARLNQEAAQAALESLQNGATAAQQQAANAAVGVAQANADIAQAQLDLLLAGATPEQSRLAEVAVQQAEVVVQQAGVTVQQSEAAVAQAQAAVAQAEAGVAAAELALERTLLRASFDGTIISLALNEGELTAVGLPVVTLGQLDQWQIETTDLTERDVPLVQEGALVSVSLDAAPDVELVGTVTAVALLPSVSRGDVVYKVTIDLLETAGLSLRWGMTAFVDIDIK